MKCLMRKSLTQFTYCVVALLVLFLPVFYFLTKHYYMNHSLAEHHVMFGIMMQFIFIFCVLAVSLILMVRFITKRLWIPFEDTLARLERFSLEGGEIPEFTPNDVKEFTHLNVTLTQLMKNSLHTYQMQKEFTENASHELQTPLAVIQSQLDSLMQLGELTEEQAHIVQNIYDSSRRLSRLNKSLLLLVKIENRQYLQTKAIDLAQLLNEILPLLDKLTGGITVHKQIPETPVFTRANRTLVESLINNLVVNAVRHNTPDGEIFVSLRSDCLTVSNTSSEGELNAELLFRRFNRTSEKVKGNGLGLAIVKAICDSHGWTIRYEYKEGLHRFIVQMLRA